MHPEEVQSLFAAWMDVFDPISGQPTDADRKLICKDLNTIFLHLPYDVEKGIHNLMGLVLDEGNYKQCYCAKFPKPTKPAVYGETTRTTP